MDDHLNLIEEYFRGNLDKDRMKIFARKLKEEPGFKNEVKNMKLIWDVVNKSAKNEALQLLKKTEESIRKAEETKPNTSLHHRRGLLSIAASLILIAAVNFFTPTRTVAPGGEEIVTQYRKHYINVTEYALTRGVETDQSTLAAKAYLAYDRRDYGTSARYFAELLASERSAAHYLYSGIANLEAGNLKTAKNNLTTVINHFDHFKEQAQWYLAMTLFKSNSDEEALSWLHRVALSNSGSGFSKDARDILSKMNMPLEKINP